VRGEQRGAALADFNHDGRVDLAVSQNNAGTKLFINRGAKRGLRVSLHGRPGIQRASELNSASFMGMADGGPAEPSSPAPVIVPRRNYPSPGLAEAPVAIWVRWPGGKEQTTSLQANAWDIRLEEKHEIAGKRESDFAPLAPGWLVLADRSVELGL